MRINKAFLLPLLLFTLIMTGCTKEKPAVQKTDLSKDFLASILSNTMSEEDLRAEVGEDDTFVIWDFLKEKKITSYFSEKDMSPHELDKKGEMAKADKELRGILAALVSFKGFKEEDFIIKKEENTIQYSLKEDKEKKFKELYPLLPESYFIITVSKEDSSKIIGFYNPNFQDKTYGLYSIYSGIPKEQENSEGTNKGNNPGNQYMDPEESKMKNIENVESEDAIVSTVEGYVHSFAEAINDNNFSIVAPYLTVSSKIYNRQQSYVFKLAKTGTKVTVTKIDVNSIKQLNNTNYSVATTESLELEMNGKKERKNLQQIYSIKSIDGQFYITDIEVQ